MLNERKRLWYALSIQTGLCRQVVYQIIFLPTMGWANFKDVTLCLLQRLVCGFHHQAIHNLTSFLDHTWDRWWYLFWLCCACLPVHWLVSCLIKQLEGTAISIFIPPPNYDTSRSVSSNIPFLGVAWQWCQLPFPQPLQFCWVSNHLWPQ